MLGVGEIMVLFAVGLTMLGGGLFAALLVRGAAGRRRHVGAQMSQVLDALSRLNSRLNDVDERLADTTLMLDETARSSERDGGSGHSNRA